MKKTNLILLCFIVSVCLNVNAQRLSDYVPAMPQITPPSPKATSFTKFGDYPVSLFTGLVDITIPIYTIDVKGVKVPIEFKYHASGIKYDDQSLEVGLGWSLIAGGTISYTARGGINSFTSGVSSFVKDASLINPTGNGLDGNDNSYMKSMVEVSESTGGTNGFDGEIDMYSYSFLNYNGKIGHIPSGSMFFIPRVPINILEAGTSNIKMRDEKGVMYLFERNVSELAYNYRQGSYYLTKIIFASDTVSFNYSMKNNPIPANAIYRPAIATVTIKEEEEWNLFSSILSPRSTTTGSALSVAFYPYRLDNITFRGGRVEFTYQEGSTGAAKRDLRTIRVYNNVQTAPIQTISLTKSLFHNSRGDRLDQVTFSNSQGESYNYQFGYNGNPYTSLSDVNYWGYYSNTQGGILNKIVYPSKGYTEFTYEAHQANNQTYGGLRHTRTYKFRQ